MLCPVWIHTNKYVLHVKICPSLLLAASDQPEQPSPAPEHTERHGPDGDTREAESHKPIQSVPDHYADTNLNPTAGECSFALYYAMWLAFALLGRAIKLCHVTNTPIYINVFDFCILQSIIYIGESATCHNVMSRLDPHKTSMLSMLNSACLFSLQPATSLSSHPAHRGACPELVYCRTWLMVSSISHSNQP